jgi:hypothetical protein
VIRKNDFSTISAPRWICRISNYLSHFPIGYSIGGCKTSFELKKVLCKQAKDDYRTECEEIEESLERYKSYLIKIAQSGKWDFTISVEGMKTHREQEMKDLKLLERSHLIKGKVKHGKRNVYREYRVTEKGAELARKLTKET